MSGNNTVLMCICLHVIHTNYLMNFTWNRELLQEFPFTLFHSQSEVLVIASEFASDKGFWKKDFLLVDGWKDRKSAGISFYHIKCWFKKAPRIERCIRKIWSLVSTPCALLFWRACDQHHTWSWWCDDWSLNQNLFSSQAKIHHYTSILFWKCNRTTLASLYHIQRQKNV